jgi:hypothetical protein
MDQNNLLAIIGVAIVVFLFFKMTMENETGIRSTYIPRPHPNATSLGFVKPEHRLLKVLSSVSSGTKVKLSGTCTELIYTKQTIPKDLNDRIVIVIESVVNTLKQVTANEYYMKKIENVYVQVDQKDNQRYIVDFFIYDVQNYYTIRLITDIVVIDGEIYINYLNVQSGSSPTLLNKYDVKFNMMGILFDANMFHENIAHLFDNYYMNSFKLMGLSDKNQEFNHEDMSEVYSLESMRNMYFPSDVSPLTVSDYHEKGLSGKLEEYLPPDQPKDISPTFCQKDSLSWDTNGVPLSKDSSSTCYSNNNSTLANITDPWFGPGVMYKRSSEDAYSWLKDPARGNIIRSTGYRQ